MERFVVELTRHESAFIAAYMQAIDFTEEAGGRELDSEFTRESTIDCLSFFSRIACYLSDDEVENAGHDFWLTRNRHGAGFWDGDWPVYGDKFTKIAQGYGEVDVLFEKLDSTVSYEEAVDNFRQLTDATVPVHDKPAYSEAWGVYIDSLCKAGKINTHDYNHWETPVRNV